jgi:hypothetical protein
VRNTLQEALLEDNLAEAHPNMAQYKARQSIKASSRLLGDVLALYGRQHTLSANGKRPLYQVRDQTIVGGIETGVEEDL